MWPLSKVGHHQRSWSEISVRAVSLLQGESSYNSAMIEYEDQEQT